MALLDKPNMKEVWASGGAAVKPSDEKIQTGWTAEVPPYQYENWIQGRQDQYLAHINQRGIPQWDGTTEYEGGGLSYAQGSDGVVYRSVAPSGPSGTVQDPTTDVDNIYWERAFADNDDPRVVSAVPNTRQVVAGVGLSGGGDLTANRTLSVDFATTAQAQALMDDTRAITPAKLADAFGGANQGFTANGFQKLPGGLIIQWLRGDATPAGAIVQYPIAFPTEVFKVVGIHLVIPPDPVFPVAVDYESVANPTTQVRITSAEGAASMAIIAFGR